MNLKVGGALLCMVAALSALVPLFTHGAADDSELAQLATALWKQARADNTSTSEIPFTKSFVTDYFSTMLIWSAAVIVLGLASAYVATRKSAKVALAIAAPATGAALVRWLMIPKGDHAMLAFDRTLAIVTLAGMALGGILLVVAAAKDAKGD